MDLPKAKQLAAIIFKVGENKVYLDPEQTKRIEEAMTKDDIRTLIAERIIKRRQDNFHSRGRSRAMTKKRQAGRKRGKGKRRGTKKVRVEGKQNWMKRVRAQRAALQELRQKNPEKVDAVGYGNVYRKIKGGFFKGKKYVTEYIEGGKQ